MAKDLRNICGSSGEGLGAESADFLENLEPCPRPSILGEAWLKICGRYAESRVKEFGVESADFLENLETCPHPTFSMSI